MELSFTDMMMSYSYFSIVMVPNKKSLRTAPLAYLSFDLGGGGGKVGGLWVLLPA